MPVEIHREWLFEQSWLVIDDGRVRGLVLGNHSFKGLAICQAIILALLYVQSSVQFIDLRFILCSMLLPAKSTIKRICTALYHELSTPCRRRWHWRTPETIRAIAERTWIAGTVRNTS